MPIAIALIASNSICLIVAGHGVAPLGPVEVILQPIERGR